ATAWRRIDSCHATQRRRRCAGSSRRAVACALALRRMETAYGLTIPRTLADITVPRDMALLVYDMQVGIVSQIKNGGHIVAQVRDVLALARAHALRVIFSRHLSLPRELMGAAQFRTA